MACHCFISTAGRKCRKTRKVLEEGVLCRSTKEERDLKGDTPNPSPLLLLTRRNRLYYSKDFP